MKKNKVVLTFPSKSVEDPIIFHLISDHGLKVNILRAAIDPGKQGRMVVELTGEEGQFSSGADYLSRNGIGMAPLTEEIRHMRDLCVSCTACVPVCPTGALTVDRETWIVSYNADRCVICLSCIDACPYRAIMSSFQ
jgi:L-aspartate semialdehyde sulfurtransferase ferredoxin